MIKNDKHDVRGYLRAGQILRKMGTEKLETAHEIYNLGLKNVSASDPNIKLLQQLRDKLTRVLSPPKSLDPFSVFPVEVAEMVLSYLDFHHLVRCATISKQWNSFLKSRMSLWQDLDFSQARRGVPYKTIAAYIKYSQRKVKRIALHRHSHEYTPSHIASNCPQLESLSVSGSEYGATTLLKMVRDPRLALRSLRLGAQVSISTDAVTQLLRFCPTLEEAFFLDIKPPTNTVDWPPLPRLRQLELRQSSITRWLGDRIWRLVSDEQACLPRHTTDHILGSPV